jgi:hypothetical protein
MARLEALVQAIEAKLPLRSSKLIQIHRSLARGLEIHLNARPEEVADQLHLLRRLHIARPEMPYPRLFLGRILSLEERYEEARTLLSGIRGQLQDRTRVLNLRARCSEILGLTAESEDLFRRSLRSKPDQADMHFRLGRLIFLRLVDQQLSPAFQDQEETRRARSVGFREDEMGASG